MGLCCSKTLSSFTISSSSLFSFLSALLIKLSMVKPDFLGFELTLDKLPEEVCNVEGENCVEDILVGDNVEDSDNSLTRGADGGGKTGGIKGGKGWFPFAP